VIMSQVIVSHAPARNSGVHTLVQYPSRRDDGTVVNHRVRRWVVDGQASVRMASTATVAAMDGFVLVGHRETAEAAIEQDALAAAAADCGAVSYLHQERLGPDVLSRIWRAVG